jgi:hypothetical protein
MYMQYREGFDDDHAHDNLSDHMMQIIMLNIPLMPRIKRAKEKKKQNDVVDIKITKEKYVEGEEIQYTGKALEWKQKIEYMYRNGKSKIVNEKEDPSEILRKVSS